MRNASATPAVTARGPDVVAVVERDRAAILHGAHRGDVLAHGRDAAPFVFGRVLRAERGRLGEAQPVRDVADERIVSRGLIGDDIRRVAAPHQFGQHVGGVGHQPDGAGDAIGGVLPHAGERVLEVERGFVEVPALQAPFDP